MNAFRKHYFLIIFGMIFFVGCINPAEKKKTVDTNPFFQSDPNLKNITDKINSSPNDATLFFKRGTMLHKMQQDSLALKDYKTAASLDTGNAAYYSAVGDLLFENKDITGSVTWLQKAIAKNPGDLKAHLKIAKLFLYIQEYNKAFAEINTALRADVHNPEAYFLKGMIYKDIKDTAKSISNFQTAVQEDPDYREAVVQLGLIYSAKKDPLATSYLDKAYKMDSSNVFPIFAKGVYYQDKKEYAQAKEEYKKCILRNRHYADAYFNMGYILMQEDSVDKAWRQYDLVVKNDPMNPTGYYNRGVCSEQMDSIKKAIEDYKMALSLDTSYRSPKDALRRLKARN